MPHFKVLTLVCESLDGHNKSIHPNPIIKDPPIGYQDFDRQTLRQCCFVNITYTRVSIVVNDLLQLNILREETSWDDDD